jgi:hypothetical protein
VLVVNGHPDCQAAQCVEDFLDLIRVMKTQPFRNLQFDPLTAIWEAVIASST